MPEPKDEVSLLIGGQEFSGWKSIDIHLSLDTYSSVEFTAPFEPENKVFREIFRPFSFKPVEVKVDGESLFTGTLVGVDPSGEVDSAEVKVSAYARPAVMADCTAPPRALPLQFKNQTLLAIMERLAEPFGIDVDFVGAAGPVFKQVKLDVDKEVSAFIAELARLRGRVITSTPQGNLLCWEAVPVGKPVARLKDGAQPVTKVTASFNPQEYFSEITAFGRAKRHRKGSRYTELNPFLRNVLRPQSFRLDNTEKGDAPAATRAKLSRMFANMASFDVDVATWRDPQGDLWTPNTTAMLTAPTVMVYRETELLLRDVSFHDDKDTKSASHNYVLPGVFNGTIPKELPWQE